MYGRVVAVVFLCLGGLAHPARAAVYQAVEGFSIASNPAGVWSYWAGDTRLTAAVGNNPLLPSMEYWWNGGSLPDSAIVGRNVSGATRTYSNTVISPADHLELDPQNVANVSVRFTANTAATYLVKGDFLGLDTREQRHGVAILHNGASIFSDTIVSFGTVAGFQFAESLAAGDTLDFASFTGVSFHNLSTGLAAEVFATPEPALTCLLGIALCLLGLARPRRLGLQPHVERVRVRALYRETRRAGMQRIQ